MRSLEIWTILLLSEDFVVKEPETGPNDIEAGLM